MALKKIDSSPRLSLSSYPSSDSLRSSPIRARLHSNVGSTEVTPHNDTELCDLSQERDIMKLVDTPGVQERRRSGLCEEDHDNSEELRRVSHDSLMRSYQLTQWERRAKVRFDSGLLQNMYDVSRRDAAASSAPKGDETQIRRYSLKNSIQYKTDAALLNQLNRVQAKMEKLTSQETAAKVRSISTSRICEKLETNTRKAPENAEAMAPRLREMFDVPEARSFSLFQVVPGAVVRKFYGKYDVAK